MFVRSGGRRFRGCMRRRCWDLRKMGFDAVRAMNAVVGAVAGVLEIADGWNFVAAPSRTVALLMVAVMTVAVAVALSQLLVLVVSVAGLSDLKQQRNRTLGGWNSLCLVI